MSSILVFDLYVILAALQRAAKPLDLPPERPAWILLPLHLAAPWFLVRMLFGAGVLYWRPADHLTRPDVAAPAVSIALDAAWLCLCWHVGYRLPSPHAF